MRRGGDELVLLLGKVAPGPLRHQGADLLPAPGLDQLPDGGGADGPPLPFSQEGVTSQQVLGEACRIARSCAAGQTVRPPLWRRYRLLHPAQNALPVLLPGKVVPGPLRHQGADLLPAPGLDQLSATFPDYFLKDQSRAGEVWTELDLAVFRRLAEKLGITRRFVGSEPFCPVTDAYNRAMARASGERTDAAQASKPPRRSSISMASPPRATSQNCATRRASGIRSSSGTPRTGSRLREAWRGT